ncbi:pyridoxamine 5'-phosphate oxidase family protein [Bosea sp. TAF32]|uniref:pyridoxamine 5'-phosphate oxidase family protein n=1 Tax=Bosea sp. TAF32 TaxID=3237482 RepID=UPI003F8F4C14
MGDRYADIAFTGTVKAFQQRMGSRDLYQRIEGGPASDGGLSQAETAFVAERDHFYIASVSETGWPYVQFRGGPPGFLRALDDKTLGFADFRGNRQYITAGNIATDDRVALLLLDYVSRRRLKIFGRMRIVAMDEDASLEERITMVGYPAIVERAALITVEAFNWNCPQHITPRFTAAECGVLLEGAQPGRRAMSSENDKPPSVRRDAPNPAEERSDG